MDKILVNAIYIWGIVQLVYSNSPPQFQTAWVGRVFTVSEGDSNGSKTEVVMTATVWMQSSKVDKEYLETFNVTTSIVGKIAVANITIRKPLDFENNTYYALRIISTDNFGKGNTVKDYFVIRVQDVQDTAPVFTSALYRTTVTENIIQGNTILVVSAVDGDFGVPRQINYTLLPESDNAIVRYYDGDNAIVRWRQCD
ncbi:hypothetical protein DPMN_164848 [Dreissena polymorpha]|uniref:Cadherin domain-containing protein n=1 Tax=Dreissena polymorpha TaxID=45954 RepID=A0A9D4IVT9_DREPO|nr:hypothetical protein DPMN_164848 [Dreissena polymorpha]